MQKNFITNRGQLAVNPSRQKVLDILEAGLNAIDTQSIIEDSVRLQGDTLTIKDQSFDLKRFGSIYVIGFGKASGPAALTLEQILGPRIKDGVVIGLKPVNCQYVKSFVGTHPLPSKQNLEAGKSILSLAQKLKPEDLVIVLVSGGGSALLCWPESEYLQGQKFYQDFLKTGGDIKEMNTVRKHLSELKGGGLAKTLYPASVVGLIFSDVPGDDYPFIASGPTYKDTSTVNDAQKVLDKYGLEKFELNETPKDDKYFEKVANVPLVSNVMALEAMAKKVLALGLKPKILSAQMYGTPEETLQEFMKAAEPGVVVLAGGEPKLTVTKTGGSGGRNSYIALTALRSITPKDTFAALASDGLDNGDAAGAIVDAESLKNIKRQKLDVDDYLERFDSYTFFKTLDHELIFTGPTEANVSDLFVFYRRA